MRHRYNYPEMPGLFTGCEYADIDTQLRKVAEELAEAREAFEEFMDIDHAVEQGKRLLERYGASMEQAGRDVYDRNRCRCRYAPGARLPR